MSNTAISVATIMLGIAVGTQTLGRSLEPNSGIRALEVPGKAWAVTPTGQDGLAVLAGGSSGRGQSGIGQFGLVACKLSPALHPNELKGVSWTRAGQVIDLFPDYPSIMTAATCTGESAIIVVIEMQGGATFFQLGRITEADIFGSTGRAASAADVLSALEEKVAWKDIAFIDYCGAKQDSFLSVLHFPSVACFEKEIFLAGQSYYPGKVEEEAVWVGKLTDTKGRRLTGYLLGRGWAPALVEYEGEL